MGSIGRRHAQNLRKILKTQGKDVEIHAFRSSSSHFSAGQDFNIDQNITDWKLLKLPYDIVFITNPTNLHYGTLLKIIDSAMAIFVEKPVFHTSSLKCDFISALNGKTTYVACPLRFHPVIEYLKKKHHDKVLSARILCSSFLPDWRKGRDYRETYSAHRDQGGGVYLDLIHEIDYAIYLFGRPKKNIRICGKFSSLEIDSDDCAAYLLSYPDKLIEIHLDYFGRKAQRKIELFCEEGLFLGDLLKNTFTNLLSDEQIMFPQIDIHEKEMAYFLEMAAKQRPTFNEINMALETLRIAEGGVLND